MATRNAKPFRFQAVGCSDTEDLTEEFPGAMSQLANLISDPATKNIWMCRPAVVPFTAIAATGTPTTISCYKIVGDILYGMVNNTTGALATFDVPFAFNLKTNAYLGVGGTISNMTLPTSQPTSGDWVPPIMDLIGVKLIVTHPGFPDGNGKPIGWFDISTPGSPVWNDGDLATNALPCPPIAVKNFNGRAWYLCNPVNGQPSAVFSDVLSATTRTNANQILTFDDSVPLTSMGTLQFENQLGGIVQALIVFKGVANLYQITGDYALSNLTKNAMNVATGTLAPLSITNTPKGMMFLSPDGFRLMDQNAVISEPLGADGSGITIPFINAISPSRVCATSNAGIIRVSTKNGIAPGTPQQEWWYDLSRNAWTGPHSCASNLMGVWKQTFVVVPSSDPKNLYQSDVYQYLGSLFTEFGAPLTFAYQTPPVPDLQEDMNQYSLNEGYVYAAFDAVGDNMTASITNEFNNAISDAVPLKNTNASSLWGTFVWGQAIWGGNAPALAPIALNWKAPVVFSRARISITGTSNTGIRFGSLYLRLEHLGYLKQP